MDLNATNGFEGLVGSASFKKLGRDWRESSSTSWVHPDAQCAGPQQVLCQVLCKSTEDGSKLVHFVFEQPWKTAVLMFASVLIVLIPRHFRGSGILNFIWKVWWPIELSTAMWTLLVGHDNVLVSWGPNLSRVSACIQQTEPLEPLTSSWIFGCLGWVR